MKEKITEKVKAHTRYKNKDGKIVPGVTTITGILGKPALVKWANNLGLKGIDSTKYVDEKASCGTLAHLMVECECKGTEPSFDDYTGNQIKVATVSFKKFIDWRFKNDFTIIKSELQLVSEVYQFGGCCDIYAMLNGKKTLLDVKTSKGIFSEMKTQVGGGYKILLEENGYEVEDVRILRLGRDEDEGFEDKQVSKLDLHKKKFIYCREIYEINKQLRGKE